MATSATNVRAGLSVVVYSAPVGTTAPTTIAASFAAGWIDLGYTTDDGIEITPSQDVKDIKAHQSLFPIRSISTGRKFEIKFTAMEGKSDVFKLAFGGGSFAVATSTATYTPAAASTVNEMALAIEMTDGSNTDRWIFPRTLVTDVQAIALKKDEAMQFGMKANVLQPTSGSIFTFLSSQTAAYPS